MGTWAKRVFALIGLIALGGVAMNAHAHWSIRRVRPELPSLAAALDLRRASPADDLPTGVYWVDTARQRTGRGGVIEPGLDPDPEAAYVMTHPGFLLAWPDGRLFLFEAGMDAETAAAFGGQLTATVGAEPIEIRDSVADRLGPAVARIAGAAVSHLHHDHTAGLVGVCAARSDPLAFFQLPPQHSLGNYTTWDGRERLERAGCLELRALDPVPLAPVPGFAGLFLVSAAGHTPGSQMLLAQVRRGDAVELWLFTGDAVNHRDAALHALPKPWLYSLLVVPEDTRRLAEVRALIAGLAAEPGVTVAVSHDALDLEERGAMPWPPLLEPEL